MSDDREEPPLYCRELSVGPNTECSTAQSVTALCMCVCVFECVWHFCSVNNSSVMGVSHWSPMTLTLSVSLCRFPPAASNHPRGKFGMHVLPGRHQHSHRAGVRWEYYSAGQKNHRCPRWADSVTPAPLGMCCSVNTSHHSQGDKTQTDVTRIIQGILPLIITRVLFTWIDNIYTGSRSHSNCWEHNGSFKKCPIYGQALK